MKSVQEVLNEYGDSNEILIRLAENGFVIVVDDEYQGLLRHKYSTYELLRAAKEMFQAHLDVKAEGKPATSEQLTEWQSVLNEKW